MSRPLPGDETPSVAELLGRAFTERGAVPVCVDGPATVQPLPTRSWAVRQVDLSTSNPSDRLLHADLTRSRTVIRTIGQPIYVAPSKSEVDAGIGLLPAGDELELWTVAEIWVAYAGTEEPATVVAHSEHWTN